MADIELMEATAEPIQTRAKRLKQRTALAHERLDRRIMSADPFASRERYAQFAKVQYEFHRDIAALYEDQALARLVPDLGSRRRLELIAQDLIDIGAPVSTYDGAPHFSAGFAADVPTALGWLYVAEGSNLGAAFLLKEAAKIVLSEVFGARHLAAAPEGRGAHWKSFVTALDNVRLSGIEEQRAIAGAEAAFLRVHVLVEQYLRV